MKSELLQDAIGLIGDDLIEEAKYINKRSKKPNIIKFCVSAVAAVLVVTILSTALFRVDNKNVMIKAGAIAEAEYPETVKYPDIKELNKEQYEVFLNDWKEDQDKKLDNFKNLDVNLNAFFEKSIIGMLSDTNDKNVVYSPLNTYMALSVMAEISAGNSQQQILDLLGVESIEQLREQANGVWNANYYDDVL